MGTGKTAGTVRKRWARFRWTWPRRIALALVLLLVLPVLTAGIALRLNYTGDPGEDTRTRGRDAIWLGHAWVDGRKGDRDLAAFAAQIEGTGIKDLYVHAGPLEHDGTLPAKRYPKAQWLIDAVHRTLPGIRVQAWLGDVLATEGPTACASKAPRPAQPSSPPRGRYSTRGSTESTSTWNPCIPGTATTSPSSTIWANSPVPARRSSPLPPTRSIRYPPRTASSARSPAGEVVVAGILR